MEYQQYQQYRPSHYPGQPHMPVRRKRVTLGGHFKNQWNNSRGFFKQWWGQKTNRQPEQQHPASYYPPQTGAGISRPTKRRRKQYQNGGLYFPIIRKIDKHIRSKRRRRKQNQKGSAVPSIPSLSMLPSMTRAFSKIEIERKRLKKARGTKQSGGGMGNLTRQTPRKQLNNVPTHFQYHQ